MRYVDNLKRMLRDHPLGMELREMHYSAEKYRIPANHGYNWRTGEENWYSPSLAIALAELLRDGDVWAPADLGGRFFFVEVKYS